MAHVPPPADCPAFELRFGGDRVVLPPRSLALAPRPGKVALITQSQSLAAAALDWALGRNIGFSWMACSGSEADIDVADLLDYAALDPRTRAVVLQVGHIRSPRKFMSAARAAAQAPRLGTVVFDGPARSAERAAGALHRGCRAH